MAYQSLIEAPKPTLGKSQGPKNVLTYYMSNRDYRHWYRSKQEIDEPAWLKDAYYAAALFNVEFQQHGLIVPDDLTVECDPIARVRVVEGVAQIDMKITLTFRDEATALLFKLSHDAVNE